MYYENCKQIESCITPGVHVRERIRLLFGHVVVEHSHHVPASVSKHLKALVGEHASSRTDSD